MKTRKLTAQAAASRVESLEVRRFLSASVISAIPTQNLSTGQSAPAVTLGSYYRDTTIPAGDSVVEIKTNLPAPNDVIPIELTDSATPRTVANFLRYISSGEYANSIFHRSATGFVLQGGQYYADGTAVTSLGVIPTEASTETLHNTAGTISAVLSTSPDSATDGFFFNLANNDGTGTTPNLNDTSDGGPFTTFGRVIYKGLSVVNTIAALPTVDGSSINSAWNTLPVQNVGVGIFGPAAATPERQPGPVWISTPVSVTALDQVAALSPNDAAGSTGPEQFTPGDVLISEPASNIVVLNPQILPGGLTFTVTSQNTNIATATVVNGQLMLAAGSAAGSTKVTIVATDLGGGTATSSFTVKVGSAAASTGSISPALERSTPASILVGASLTLKEKLLLKAGASGFTGNASGALLLSTTGNAVDSVATLGSASAKLKLKANQSHALSLTSVKNLSSSMPVGTYHVLVQSIDSSGTTTVDTGKTMSIGIGQVDLWSTIARIPATAKAGAVTHVSLTISNAASATLAATALLPYQIEASPDGKLSDATVMGSGKVKISLKPGRHASVSVPVKLKTAGGAHLIVVLDPGAVVFASDSNLANNTFVSATATKVL